MTTATFLKRLLLLLALLCSASVFAQAPGVKIVHDRGEEFETLVEKANACRKAGALLAAGSMKEQVLRTSCVLTLPKPATKKLSDREIWQRSKESHVRLGWHFLCDKCEKWHLDLSGGSFITSDGVIATCFHVVKPHAEHREAYLVAADDAGNLFPVTEVLAGNELADVALVRAKVGSPVKPMSLNTNVYPGDGAWCYSDPLGRASYFSKGMVNRFYFQEGKERSGPRIEVSTDWAPGSSGAAIVDECANIMGIVSTISASRPPRSSGTNQPSGSAGASSANAGATMIVFHCAARAADVVALIQPPEKH
jgi:hypothetical protein